MNTLEGHLTGLRRERAGLEPWTDAWMVAWLQETHLEAEALRRAAGWSCGCALCQQFPWDRAKKSEVGTEPPPVPVLPASHADPPRLKGATNHRGRIPAPFPLERLRELAANGLGAKAAHATLLSEGHRVALRTLSRRLAELRP